jgi:hypothetical protein
MTPLLPYIVGAAAYIAGVAMIFGLCRAASRRPSHLPPSVELGEYNSVFDQEQCRCSWDAGGIRSCDYCMEEGPW